MERQLALRGPLGVDPRLKSVQVCEHAVLHKIYDQPASVLVISGDLDYFSIALVDHPENALSLSLLLRYSRSSLEGIGRLRVLHLLASQFGVTRKVDLGTQE